MHMKGLEALDRTMKDLRGNNRIMGGAVVVLAGDFRQTLPVIPRSTPADELNASFKASHIWTKVIKKALTTNMGVRQQGDESSDKFAKQLLCLGEGKFPSDPMAGLRNKLLDQEEAQFLRKEELVEGVLYPVENLEKLETRFGCTLVAEINYQGIKRRIFLPKYLQATEEEIKMYNENGGGDENIASNVNPGAV
ncbi:hypothetical protein J437_LFUL015858 [Ladona fulva]|uniref:ATP-dependent DNA helicase n=1 Tax=Ladona fulva TaxID=123851 RepID=A0A8K0KJF5_LADFU|nr:hypothetical protein J437_LFUL015858 [Ladona fulva]